MIEEHIRAIVKEELARLTIPPKQPDADEYLSTAQVAELTGLSKAFFEVGRSYDSPGQPPYHKIGRRVLYRRTDIVSWLENRRRGHK